MTDARFSEYVRSTEWRCIVCGYINTMAQDKCGDCGCDTDGVSPATELTKTDIMAQAVFNAGVDPALEPDVILVLMNVGYRAREIMENLDVVKIKAWAKRFKVNLVQGAT